MKPSLLTLTYTPFRLPPRGVRWSKARTAVNQGHGSPVSRGKRMGIACTDTLALVSGEHRQVAVNGLDLRKNAQMVGKRLEA